MKKITSIAILMLVVVLTIGVVTSCEFEKAPKAETVYLAKDKTTEYSIVWSDQGVTHSTSAQRIKNILNLSMEIEAEGYEYTEKTKDKEILIGKTDRAVSVELVNEVNAAVSGDKVYAFGYGYKDGKLAYYANSPEALDYSWATFFMLLRTEEDTLSCQSDLWVVKSFDAAEYSAYLDTTVPYYISYELDGGTLASGTAPLTYYYSKGVDLPTKATKLGFEFAGWYSNPDFRGKAITSISKDYEADLTVYAKWTKVAALINYELDGGSVVGDVELPAVKADGTKITLPSLTKAYSVFIGWWDNADFEGDPITEIPAEGIEDVTVYAKFDGSVKQLVNDKITNGKYAWGDANLGNKGTYDLGSAMIAAGTTKATIKIDLAASGNSAWAAGRCRLRPGQVGTSSGNNLNKEVNIIKLSGGYMTTSNGVALTASNSGDVVDIVIDFSIKTMYYYVNGVHKATETSDNFNTDLLCYDYCTNASGYSAKRGNFIQFADFGSEVIKFDFMGLFVSEWITPAAE